MLNENTGLGEFEPGWWPLFRLIAEQRDLTPGSAALALGLTPAAISQTAAAMLRAGLLTEHADPRDARVCHLRLSAAGQQCLPRLTQIAREMNLQLVAVLGEDASSLRRALAAIEKPW